MANSRKTKHGSGKVYKPKPLRYDPKWTNKVTNDELRAALKAALTLPQLIALEKQIADLMDRNVENGMITAYKGMWAVAMRVLHDRFGFEEEDKKRLWDISCEYLDDLEAGRMDLQGMLETLEYEDGVVIRWTRKSAKEVLESREEEDDGTA